jgi:flavin reductase (DIM6/NTAB) family NADH-FMN oxidoreductase RutF
MNKQVSGDIGKFYQHYPRTACVITARSAGVSNAMAVAWHTSISFSPPLFGVSISPKRFTYGLVAQSREFGVNFMPFARVELVASVGGSKGGEVDKFQRFQIGRDESVKTGVPILDDAYAAYECRLVDDRSFGDHQLLVGEVVAVHFDPAAFSVDGTLNLDRVGPVLYLGNDLYLTIQGETVERLDREVYGKH